MSWRVLNAAFQGGRQGYDMYSKIRVDKEKRELYKKQLKNEEDKVVYMKEKAQREEAIQDQRLAEAESRLNLTNTQLAQDMYKKTGQYPDDWLSAQDLTQHKFNFATGKRGKFLMVDGEEVTASNHPRLYSYISSLDLDDPRVINAIYKTALISKGEGDARFTDTGILDQILKDNSNPPPTTKPLSYEQQQAKEREEGYDKIFTDKELDLGKLRELTPSQQKYYMQEESKFIPKAFKTAESLVYIMKSNLESFDSALAEIKPDDIKSDASNKIRTYLKSNDDLTPDKLKKGLDDVIKNKQIKGIMVAGLTNILNAKSGQTVTENEYARYLEMFTGIADTTGVVNNKIKFAFYRGFVGDTIKDYANTANQYKQVVPIHNAFLQESIKGIEAKYYIENEDNEGEEAELFTPPEPVEVPTEDNVTTTPPAATPPPATPPAATPPAATPPATTPTDTTADELASSLVLDDSSKGTNQPKPKPKPVETKKAFKDLDHDDKLDIVNGREKYPTNTNSEKLNKIGKKIAKLEDDIKEKEASLGKIWESGGTNSGLQLTINELYEELSYLKIDYIDEEGVIK